MASSRSMAGGGGGRGGLSRGRSRVLAMLAEGPTLPSTELSLLPALPTCTPMSAMVGGSLGADTLCLEPD